MSGLDWLLLILATLLGLVLLFVVRRYLDTPVNLPSPPAAHERDSELLTLVDALPVGVLVTDRHATVLRCNAAAADLLGLSPEAVVGLSLIHSLRDYELAELLRRVLAGQGAGQEFNLNYNRRYLLANVSVLGRDQNHFGLLVLQDVTQIRRIEQVRRDFVANVSHEFRTPLATAKLLVETAQAAVEDDPAAAQVFLNKVNRELDSLTRLVSELLDLSRIEAGQTPLQLRPISLKQALELEISRAEEQAARHGQHLELAPIPDLTVMADESRLSQVIGNLVQNAIKFTPAGGSITVSARQCDEQPSATISVADTGIGIPPEDLERVFERFYKVDRARSAMLADGSEQGGTGLGLAIARHIVAAQGGRIWAESDAHGATFHFTVPLAISVSNPPAATLYSRGLSKKGECNPPLRNTILPSTVYRLCSESLMPNRPSRQKALLYLAIITLLLVGCDLGNTAPVTFQPGLPTVLPRSSVTLLPDASPTTTLTPYAVKSFAPIAGGANKLIGAGASVPAPLYANYFAAYASQYKVQVDYYPTDSGLGIRQFGSKAVDFAATDVPLTDTQMVSPTIQGGVVQHIPTAIIGLAIVYNLPNSGARLRFSANTLADIYRGSIVTWSDPLIAADNPNVDLPTQPIAVMHRADYSGSSYIFSQYLAAHNDNFRYAVGASATPHWPVGSGVQDSFSMVRAIKQKPYSIGYVSLAYAMDNNLAFADIENKAGNFVSPNPQSLAGAAATITTVPDDLRISLVDPPGWTSYPLTGFTWLLVYRDQSDMAKAIATVNLLRWILDVGQASNAAHQFAPLPSAIAARADLLIQQLNVNGTAIYGAGFKPSPTPDPTPTVTGTPPTATPTASETPTRTATLTPTISLTPFVTDTPTQLPTAPPTDTPHPQSTNTSLPPTDTPLPVAPLTNTPLPPPTNTPPPPPPSNTPAPPPTYTPIPPPPRPRPTPTEGK